VVIIHGGEVEMLHEARPLVCFHLQEGCAPEAAGAGSAGLHVAAIVRVWNPSGYSDRMAMFSPGASVKCRDMAL
jgi:hypothetical protein